MREITNQTFRRLNREEFNHCSSTVKGEGDDSLPEDASVEDWKKVIVLKPKGKSKTIFSPGFRTVFGDTLISDAVRRVGEEQPFGMRMGPEDCEFFIVSNEEEVDLEFVEYVDINDEERADLPLY